MKELYFQNPNNFAWVLCLALNNFPTDSNEKQEELILRIIMEQFWVELLPTYNFTNNGLNISSFNLLYTQESAEDTLLNLAQVIITGILESIPKTNAQEIVKKIEEVSLLNVFYLIETDLFSDTNRTHLKITIKNNELKIITF